MMGITIPSPDPFVPASDNGKIGGDTSEVLASMARSKKLKVSQAKVMMNHASRELVGSPAPCMTVRQCASAGLTSPGSWLASTSIKRRRPTTLLVGSWAAST